MGKKKIFEEQEECCIEDIPIVTPSKTTKAIRLDPDERLKDKDFVALALFEALSDGDERPRCRSLS